MPSLNKFRLRLVNLIDSNLNKIEKKALGGFYKIAYNSNQDKMNKLLKYIESNKVNNIKMNIKSFYEYINKNKNIDNDNEYKNLTNNSTIIIFRKLDENIKNKKNKRHISYNGIKYIQIRTMNVSTNKAIEKYLHKRIFEQYNKDEYKDLIKILSVDKTFLEFYLMITDYCDCICVLKTESIINNNDISGNYIDNIMNDNNFNDELNRLVFSKYINYISNINASNFKDLFKNKVINYVKENYKKNSCLINCIIDCFKNSFDQVKRDNKRKYRELTYEYLLHILDIDSNLEDNIGISINRMDKFFDKFRLGYDIVNQNDILIKTFRPTQGLNNNIKPNIMRIMLTNYNHVVLLNDELKSFDKIKNINDLIDNDSIINNLVNKFNIQISDKFYIKNEDQQKIENKIIIIKELNDLVEVVNSFSNLTNQNINCIYNESLENLLVDIYYNGYCPKITFENGNIKKIKIKIGEEKDKNIITITNVNKIESNDCEIAIDNIDVLTKYNNEFSKFYDYYFNKRYLSTYHSNTLDIDNYYSIGPISGFLGKIDNYPKNLYNTVDIRKCYTSCLMKIKTVPIYEYFDMYKVYDNSNIEPYNKYIIKIKSNNEITNMMFNKEYNRCYGFKLLSLKKFDIKYDIIYYCMPSKLINVDFKKPIEDLYNSTIDNEDPENDKYYKKMIVNICCGLYEKKYNKTNVSEIFENKNKALLYSKYFDNCSVKEIIKYIYSTEDHEQKTVFNPKNNPLDTNCEEIDEEERVVKLYDKIIIDTKKLYAVVFSKEKELTSNFRVIKDMIYDFSHLAILDIYNKLIENKFSCIGIKTDCILYTKMNPNKEITQIFDISDKIGNYKIEEKKTCPTTPINFRISNELIDIKPVNVVRHQVNNERDTNEINNILDKLDKCLILGEHAGVGKTTLCKNYCDKEDLLIISKFNNLCIENNKEGYNSCTLNMLLGIHVEEDKNIKMRKKDISDFKVIVFDEIYLYDPRELENIYKFILNNPDKKILATGDTNQLKTFGYSSNLTDLQKYIADIIDFMFNNRIVLEEIKRIDNLEDIERIKNLKIELFNIKDSKEIIPLLRKYNFNIINSMDQVKTKNSICYFNFRCDQVNNYIHNNLIDIPENFIELNEIKYFIGMNLICKKYLCLTNTTKNSTKKIKLHVNHKYKIVNYTDKLIELYDEIKDKTIFINHKQLYNFKLSYSRNIYSIQGLSTNEPVCIFDINTPYVDVNYIYVSLTRNRNLNDIYIYEHSEKEIKALTKSKIKLYLKNKINGYINQDEIANRDIDEDNYVDVDFILDLFNKNKYCNNCRGKYYLYINDGNVYSNITIQRNDNSLSHIKENCSLICKICNSKLSNKF